jgi:DUF4097 and DUF4098 domain-containing protein YvlB
MKKHKCIWLVFGLATMLFTGCSVGVNRSINVRNGESSHGLASVNGSLYVGSHCRVDGDSHTVNGIVDVGEESQVRNLDTVNGRIRLGANVDVEGDVRSVNGAIDCGRGSKIHGRLTTINGRIELRNTEVDEEVSTVNGDVLLREKSVVRGDIIIKGKNGFLDHRRLEIRIDDGSRVEGGIIVPDEDVDVKVYLSRDSIVKGEIRNAQVIKE